MNIKRRSGKEPQGHASALNDILFVLLLFFLIISTLANPNVVKLSIPKAKSDTKAKQTVVVSINDKQEFFVGTKAVLVDSLKPFIAGAIAKSQDAEPTVVINADKQASADNIVAVMRAAHDLNLRTVLAVENNSR
ncbi:MAG: biopolymer transporter ExbD [Flavipsychrobacter sp.]|nr:biopolymer transporter ExbD [Flavipsychrobacter sp.]